MKRAYVLVEGTPDQAFLRRVLPPEATNEVEIVFANGSYNIPSLARTLLVERHTPVAVVMDSHSLDPEVRTEKGTHLFLQPAHGRWR
jgi:hypothetical protein